MARSKQHRFAYPGSVRTVHRVDTFDTSKPIMVVGPERVWSQGVADDAPYIDHERSPQLLRDLAGVVHTVVKGDDGFWKYCDIAVMRDWLEQNGRNLVPDDTVVTCIRCMNQDFEG